MLREQHDFEASLHYYKLVQKLAEMFKDEHVLKVASRNYDETLEMIER